MSLVVLPTLVRTDHGQLESWTEPHVTQVVLGCTFLEHV